MEDSTLFCFPALGQPSAQKNAEILLTDQFTIMQTHVALDTSGLRVIWDDVKRCYCFEDSNEGTLPIGEGQLLPFTITMHSGDPKENGFTGPTIEALLAVAQHRIETYNQGVWRCEENDKAIHHIKESLFLFFKRFLRMRK